MPKDLKPDLSATEPPTAARVGWRRKAFPAVAVVCPLFLLLATPLAARWIETDVRDRVNESARLNGLSPLGITVEGRDVILGRTPTPDELVSAEEHLRSLRGVGVLRVRDEGSVQPLSPVLDATTTTSSNPTDSFTPVEVEDAPAVISGTPAFDVTGVSRESGALVPGSSGVSDEDDLLVPSGAFDASPDSGVAGPTSSTTVAVEGVAAATLVGPRASTTTTTKATVPPTTSTTTVGASTPATTAAAAEAQTTPDSTTTTNAVNPTTTAPTTTARPATTTTVPVTAPPTTVAPTTTTQPPVVADATPGVIIEIAPTDVLISGKVGSDDERDAVLAAFAGGAQTAMFTNAFVVEQGHASLISGALADYLALLDTHAAYASVTIEPGLIEVIAEVPTDAAAEELDQAATTLQSVGWQVDGYLEVNI